jgi:hypothetical protein
MSDEIAHVVRCRDMKKYASKEDTQMFAAAEWRDKRLMQLKEDAQYLQLQKRDIRMMQAKQRRYSMFAVTEERQKSDASEVKKVLIVCSCRGQKKE